MSKNLYKYLLIVSISLLLILSCEYHASSFGDFQKIVVFTDSTVFSAVQTELQQVFDQFLYTPHMERSFYMDLQPLKALDTYQARRNILFVGLLNGGDAVSNFITQSLSDEIKTGIEDGRYFEIFQNDLFATEQVVMFFTAPDTSILKKSLRDRADIIFDRLNRSYFERLKFAMFLKGEQVELSQYLAEKYGWNIRIQHDYQLVMESEDGRFTWLRRLNPDRSLFVARIRQRELDLENKDDLFDLRDSLTTVYYEADSIDKKDTFIQVVDFQDLKALKLSGVWQNHQHLIGGPFRTYIFNAQDKYTYLLDMTVTAPGQRKKVLLDQLDVMARTFHFVNSK